MQRLSALCVDVTDEAVRSSIFLLVRSPPFLNPMDPSLTGLGDVLIGSLLGIIGLAAMVLSLVRRPGTDPLLASFGAFATLYGVRLIFSNPLTPALGASQTTSVWIHNLVTYVILVPAWYFFWKLLGDGWRSLNLWWVRVVAIFAVIAVVSDLSQGIPGTLQKLNNVIVILGLVIIASGLWTYRGRMTTELRILLGGLSIFGLFAINENLAPWGILPWSWRGETGGFLVFVGCLGWIAVRRSLATERELASVAGELEAGGAASRLGSGLTSSLSVDWDARFSGFLSNG